MPPHEEFLDIWLRTFETHHKFAFGITLTSERKCQPSIVQESKHILIGVRDTQRSGRAVWLQLVINARLWSAQFQKDLPLCGGVKAVHSKF